MRRARQELVRREAHEALASLIALVQRSTNEALVREAFWSYLALQSPTPEDSQDFLQHAAQLLQHPQAVVRYWTVRWLGDCGQISDELAHQLDSLAETEPSPHVRSQLASTAARLPAYQALQSSTPTSIAISITRIRSCLCNGGGQWRSTVF